MILQLRTKTHIILSVKIHECHNNYASPLWYNMSGIGGLRQINTKKLKVYKSEKTLVTYSFE